MSTLLLVPLEDTVVFPNMNITLAADVGDEEQVLLVPKHESEYAKVGTVAEVSERVRLPGGAQAVALCGPAPRRRSARPAPTRKAACASRSRSGPTRRRPRDKTRELEVEYRAVVEEILELRGADERVSAFVRAIREPGALADTAGYSPDLTFEQKVELLETVDVVERLELALRFQRERLAELQVRRRIREDVESGAQKQQREYILRKQMESIRKELGEDDGVRRRASTARRSPRPDMPDEVREQAERELGRLERMGDASRRGLDDPHLPRLAARRAVGRSAPRSGSTRCTRARCSTPTTPASRTSRSASSSTSPCASCARSAASPRTSAPARS